MFNFYSDVALYQISKNLRSTTAAPGYRNPEVRTLINVALQPLNNRNSSRCQAILGHNWSCSPVGATCLRCRLSHRLTYHNISYHPGHRFATNKAEEWPNAQALPECEGVYVVYPGVGGTLLLPLFLLAVHVCSVCKGEGGGCAYYFTS